MSIYKKHNKGFTLIELLVVIAIVGVLSAIVLGQLNSARNKGSDAAAQTAFKNLLIPGTNYYYDVNNESYNGVCNSQTSPAKFEQIWQSVAGAQCTNGSTSYRVRVQLKSGQWLCVDQTGNFKTYGADPLAGPGTGCP